MQNTYFALLPNEIKFEIFKNLKHFDVLQFLEAFPEFNYEFRHLDLSFEYKIINMPQIVSKNKLVFEHITSLNVNHLYWMSAIDLRKFINELINLKSLYAICTKLDLAEDDIKTYNHTKIEKLAITSSHFIEADDRNPIPSVKLLYIGFNLGRSNCIVDDDMTSTKLMRLFPNVTKIWVDDNLCYSSSARNHLEHFTNYEKVFIRYFNTGAWFDRIKTGRYFHTYFRGFGNIICIDKLDCKELQQPYLLPYLIENHAEDALWSSVLKMLGRIPFSPNVTRDLVLNRVNLGSLCLRELNFDHYCVARNEDGDHLTFLKKVRDILSSKNAQTLRSLSVTRCVLSDFQEIEHMKKLFDNLSNLEELVLCLCDYSYSSRITGYSFISNCKNLRSLSIEISSDYGDGLFLSIFKECRFLETVKVNTGFTYNDPFNHNFLKAIPTANNLKDLYFANNYVPIESCLTTLTTMQSRKLQRLALCCIDSNDRNCAERSEISISRSSLKALINRFPQLTFLLIFIKNANSTSVETLRQSLKELSTHPAQVFVMPNNFDDPIIPPAHRDLLTMGAHNVSSIDPIRDFACF